MISGKAVIAREMIARRSGGEKAASGAGIANASEVSPAVTREMPAKASPSSSEVMAA